MRRKFHVKRIGTAVTREEEREDLATRERRGSVSLCRSVAGSFTIAVLFCGNEREPCATYRAATTQLPPCTFIVTQKLRVNCVASKIFFNGARSIFH